MRRRRFKPVFLLAVSVYFGLFVARFYLLKPRSVQIVRGSDPIGLWPDDRRIFFHETSGASQLNGRQMCAVESAAKFNPERPVQIFLQTDGVQSSSLFLSIFQYYPNVAVILLNTSDYFRDTPLDSWFRSALWKTSPYANEHFSDYIRMLSLYKGGGMYMDLDFITLKRLDVSIFWNFIPRQDGDYLTGSTLHLQHKHRLIRLFLKRLASTYSPDKWAAHGPDLINSIIRKFGRHLPDIRILPSTYFYPFPYDRWSVFFQNATDSVWHQMKHTYAVHVWNKLSKSSPVRMGSDQLYSKLAAKHCPRTFELAGTTF